MALITELFLMALETHRIGLEACNIPVAAHGKVRRVRQFYPVAGNTVLLAVTEVAFLPVRLGRLPMDSKPFAVM